jgi:hypothetical protein
MREHSRELHQRTEAMILETGPNPTLLNFWLVCLRCACDGDRQSCACARTAAACAAAHENLTRTGADVARAPLRVLDDRENENVDAE